jgi:hypothetical protein
MLTFLFWNMGGQLPVATRPAVAAERKRRMREIIGNLVRIHDVDLLMVAEWPIEQDEILKSVNAHTRKLFQPPDPLSLCDRILIFPRFPAKYLLRAGGAESPRYTCRNVRLPGRKPFLLFAAHLGSKRWKSEDSQTLAAPGFSRTIRGAERTARHQRTILVGDLNMNPFDAALVGGEGLNAVMTREVAIRESRTVDANEYPFFYNPMWGHFGDATHEDHPPGHPEHSPPGTCYYPAGESRWYYWNMFDQILLRPAVLPFFSNKDVKILIGDRTTSFLDRRGIPDRAAVSDHLPILFRLNI